MAVPNCSQDPVQASPISPTMLQSASGSVLIQINFDNLWKIQACQCSPTAVNGTPCISQSLCTVKRQHEHFSCVAIYWHSKIAINVGRMTRLYPLKMRSSVGMLPIEINFNRDCLHQMKANLLLWCRRMCAGRCPPNSLSSPSCSTCSSRGADRSGADRAP